VILLRINIAACDSDINDCNVLKSIIHRFCLAQDITVKIDIYSKKDDFLTSIYDSQYDIVFLESDPDGINGIDIVNSLKDVVNLKKTLFIFFSNSPEYAIEAFNLNAVHYLLKPLSSDGVTEAMKRCIIRMNMNCSKFINVTTSHRSISIPIGNIVYIEVINKICTIHTEKNTYETYSTLDSMGKQMDSDLFLRANRSFIVNMNHIEYFHFDHIILSDHTYVSLSRNNRSKLKEQYSYFLRDMALRGAV
jgi:DNA-binding LytR/AlgR family response regulator